MTSHLPKQLLPAHKHSTHILYGGQIIYVALAVQYIPLPTVALWICLSALQPIIDHVLPTPVLSLSSAVKRIQDYSLQLTSQHLTMQVRLK